MNLTSHEHLKQWVITNAQNPPESKNSMEAKLSVRGLSKYSKDGEMILEGISFTVQKGTILALIGPSGSGKSTVLRALNRLWEPPKSTVFLDNRDILDLEVRKLRRRVGMVFQSPNLFDGTFFISLKYVHSFFLNFPYFISFCSSSTLLFPSFP